VRTKSDCANLWPDSFAPASVGLDASAPSHVELLHERHGNRLYRVVCGERSFVLKWFGENGHANAVQAYALLESCGVPTLPVHGRADNALLLEDLEASETWRLATEGDKACAETGTALADWYKLFHEKGRRFLAEADPVPEFLSREIDALNSEVVLTAGEKLGVGEKALWRLAAEHVEALAAAMRALPETFNYNDFYWGNLALSREAPLRAIVFDYHLLGIGIAYSDCRNVCWSIGKEAREAFWEGYGALDEREAILDEPMSILFSLAKAAGMPKLPRWAEGVLQHVTDGRFERALRRSLEVV
jgi:Phosphotransferase enzyme family